MTDPALAPSYLLRREPFGGIVWDPLDGTQLELDHEGYGVARELLCGRGIFWRGEKRAFARRLRAQLGLHRLRRAREIDPGNWESLVEVPSLSLPSLVDFQITDRCDMGCPHCYASSEHSGEHVPWEDLVRVVDQCADCGVCQIAIGGGEPLQHPQIVELLAYCRQRGLVPNLTTGGTQLDDPRLVRALKRHCGAVGLSLEGIGEHYDRWRHSGWQRFLQALATLKAARVPTVLQIVVSAANLEQLDEITAFCAKQEHLYGVIFLAYKQVGRGAQAGIGLGSLPAPRVTAALKGAFDRLHGRMRVGYDCCLTPGIAGVEEASAFAQASNLEGCSATRGSVGVSTALEVIPCTFTTQIPLGNLRDRHLRDIWRDHAAERFRAGIANHRGSPSCTDCGKRSACLGGCPVMPLVNCHRDHLHRRTYPA